jgi:hypothetical protein
MKDDGCYSNDCSAMLFTHVIIIITIHLDESYECEDIKVYLFIHFYFFCILDMKKFNKDFCGFTISFFNELASIGDSGLDSCEIEK